MQTVEFPWLFKPVRASARSYFLLCLGIRRVCEPPHAEALCYPEKARVVTQADPLFPPTRISGDRTKKLGSLTSRGLNRDNLGLVFLA